MINSNEDGRSHNPEVQALKALKTLASMDKNAPRAATQKINLIQTPDEKEATQCLQAAVNLGYARVQDFQVDITALGYAALAASGFGSEFAKAVVGAVYQSLAFSERRPGYHIPQKSPFQWFAKTYGTVNGFQAGMHYALHVGWLTMGPNGGLALTAEGIKQV